MPTPSEVQVNLQLMKAMIDYQQKQNNGGQKSNFVQTMRSGAIMESVKEIETSNQKRDKRMKLNKRLVAEHMRAAKAQENKISRSLERALITNSASERNEENVQSRVVRIKPSKLRERLSIGVSNRQSLELSSRQSSSQKPSEDKMTPTASRLLPKLKFDRKWTHASHHVQSSFGPNSSQTL